MAEEPTPNQDNTEDNKYEGVKPEKTKEPEGTKKDTVKIVGDTIKGIFEVISEAIKHYVEKKYRHDYVGLIVFGVIVLFILVTICFLAFYSKINEAAIGTILGSLIGYALGRFNSNDQNRER